MNQWIFRLVIGSLCGAVILFESALRRTILQDKFELTFVAPSQVLIKELQESPGENILIESQLGLEIYDVRIMGQCYLNNVLFCCNDSDLPMFDVKLQNKNNRQKQLPGREYRRITDIMRFNKKLDKRNSMDQIRRS